MKLRLLSSFILCLFFVLEASAQCSSGRISNDATGSTQSIELCTRDGQADEVTFRPDYQVTTDVATIITNTRGQILASAPGRTFDFEGFAEGTCRALLLSYTGTLTTTIGDNVYSVPLSTGCYRLSSNFIQINHRVPVAGSITDSRGMSSASICVGDSTPDYIGYSVSGQDADRYVYLITDVDGNVEMVDFDTFENFGNLAPGTSLVYGLAYSGQLLVQPGQNIFTDPLVDGCFDLTDDFITIVRNDVDGGQLKVGGEEHIQVDSSTSQAPFVVRTSTSASPYTYVIIDERSIIRGFSRGPAVDLSFLPAAKYFIYAYSYTGNIQAEVGQRLWDSGVRFASGCFMMSDNAIVVTKTTPASTTSSCLAYAGEISAVASPVTIQNGIARVEAIQDGSAIVPSSYDSVYFLTVGPSETIIALSIAGPNFSVSNPDTLTIYYLNAEVTDAGSPDFIDLGAIQFGVTTMGQLAASIMDSGVCADLTNPGAEVIVLPDPSPPCNIFSSSVIQVLGTVPLVNGEATLEATPDGGASLPASAELTFILSQGFEQTIIALSDTPSFDVTEVGQYAIHALAAETSDPTSLNYLDRSDWVSNELDIFDAFDVINAEGICAFIDLFGAEFQVTSGSSCAAFAGTVTPATDTVFLANGMVRITATPDRNAVVPLNFDRTYVLSFGPNKIIQAISAIPRFDVTSTGDYFIHPWVGEFTDPNAVDYVNLNAIQQGISPISDIVLQIQGSGICSSIDENGANVFVEQTISTIALQLRPVRVGEYLRVGNAYASQPQQGQLVVLDALGREVTRKVIQLSDQPQTFEIGGVRVPGGVYYLSLIGAIDGVLTSQGFLLN